MKFLLFIAIQLIALISLSSQKEHYTVEEDLKFPIKAVAVLRGEVKDPITNLFRDISGVVHFVQEARASKVQVSVDIKGLPTYTGGKVVKRGFHIHEFGISVASDNFTAVCGSTGGHYNPTNETHGFLDSPVRHIGDLGNLITYENGTILESLVDDRLSLWGKFSIIGRSIVLHDGEDDGGLAGTPMSRAAGNSGARIACGVIGYEKAEVKSVSRSLFTIITTQTFDDGLSDLTNGTFMGFEDQQNKTKYFGFEDANVDVDDMSVVNDLNEFSKTLPQTREIFKLFFKILKNMIEQAQDANSPLTQSLKNFELPIVSDIQISIQPQAEKLVADDKLTPPTTTTISQLDPSIETINLV